jgi:hypothetical protein
MGSNLVHSQLFVLTNQIRKSGHYPARRAVESLEGTDFTYSVIGIDMQNPKSSLVGIPREGGTTKHRRQAKA